MITLDDIAPCAIFSFDNAGVITAVNRAMISLLNENESSLIGRKVESLLNLAGKIFFQTHLWPLVRMRGNAEEIFLTLLKNDKEEIPILLNCRQHQDQQGNQLYLCAFITVHNRKVYEDQLRAARNLAEDAIRDNSALKQAKDSLERQAEDLDRQLTLVLKKNDELAQVSRVVTHELQEPLRKISIFTDQLTTQSTQAIDPSIRRTIDTLSRSASRMRAIVAGLQEYIWLQETPVDPAQIRLADLTQIAHQRLQKESSEQVLTIDLAGEPLIQGDRSQFELLFYHLFSNAYKFRKESVNPHISIATSIIQQNQFQQVRDKYKFRDYQKIVLSDNTRGFDAKYRDIVFGLFVQLKKTTGNGIGLALCKKIVENHSGTISVDSLEGEGATITVITPLR